VLLYFYPNRLGILREIAILIAPMELATIGLGFVANALVSYHIQAGAYIVRKTIPPPPPPPIQK
jgi:hypothetical protein